MRKLLMLIGAMIICNAYGGTAVYWLVDNDTYWPNAITTCNSSGNITTPATPQKDGYRFIGWKTSTLIPAIVTQGGSTWTPNQGTNKRLWTMTNKDKGNLVITGEARCSSTTGTTTTTTACGTRNSNPATTANVNGSTLSTTEQNCWCRITNYGGIAVPNMDWLFYYKYTSSSTPCATYCASSCAYYMYNTRSNDCPTCSKFRRCILGLN